MIKEIDRDLIKRVSNAIFNVRTIASHAKPRYRIESVATGAYIVSVVDAFRKFCYLNEGRGRDYSVTLTFGIDGATYKQLVDAAGKAHMIFTLLTEKDRNKYKQEYRHVEHLFNDMKDFVRRVGGVVV